MLILQKNEKNINISLNSNNSIISDKTSGILKYNEEVNKEFGRIEVDNLVNSYLTFNFNRDGGSDGYKNIGYTQENGIMLNKSFYFIKIFNSDDRYIATNYIPTMIQSIEYSTFDLTSTSNKNYIKYIYLPIKFMNENDSYSIKVKYYFYSALNGKVYFFSDTTKKEYVLLNVDNNKWSFNSNNYFTILNATNNPEIDKVLGDLLSKQEVVNAMLRRDVYYDIESNSFK